MSDGLSNASSAFARLSTREQLMVVGMALVLVAVAVTGISFLVGSRLDKADRRLADSREKLAQIEALEGRFRQAESAQAADKAKLQRNPVQLFSLLNNAAKELGFKLDNLNERRSTNKEAGVDEVSVDVTLKDMSITKLNKFLDKMEGPSSNGMVKVTKLKVKTSFGNEELLDVTMTVATYRLAGAGAGSGGGGDEPAAGGGK